MIEKFLRVLRTPSSERFLVQSGSEKDIAALDLHYLADGSVSGTLILLEDKAPRDLSVPDLLAKIDEVLLPNVSVEEKNLTFTVVRGRVEGDFVPDES